MSTMDVIGMIVMGALAICWAAQIVHAWREAGKPSTPAPSRLRSKREELEIQRSILRKLEASNLQRNHP